MIESEYGTTDLAMNQGRFHGDETLLVRFVMRPFHDKAESIAQGRPIYVEKPYIEIRQPGNKDTVVIKPAGQIEKQRFPEHWKRFEAREDQNAIVGMPLTEWAGVNRSQCEELKHLNVRTVEQLSEMSDSNAQGIMGIQMLKTKAKKYMETAKDEKAAEALEGVRAENAELRAMIEEIKAGAAEAPKKRGRPKKEAAED